MRFILIPILYFSFSFFACQPPSERDHQGAEADSVMAPGVEAGDPQIQPSTDFYAFDRDEGWNLMIDFDSAQMHFSYVDEPYELILPLPDSSSMQDLEAISYEAQADYGQLIVSIYEDSCQDDVTGQSFPYFVRVSAKTDEMDDFDKFKGCGRYMGEYRLNGRWVLVSRNGEMLDTTRELPGFSLSLNSRELMGDNGCNRLSGKVTARDSTLAIGPLQTTDEKCPNNDLAALFTAGISGREVPYELNAEEKVLTLHVGEEETWRLVRGS